MTEMYTKPLQITNYSGIAFEADVLMVTKAGMVYEYEIKTSRSDFKKDFSKVGKHRAYSNKNIKTSKWRDYPKVPNHFYYVCVEGLIKPEEVPEYAGLIWVMSNKTLKLVKKAQKLHSYKITAQMVWNIATTLSARAKYGCSYLRYKQHGK